MSESPGSIRVLLVIAPEAFRDEEFFEPYSAMTDQGFTVTVASTRTGTAQGMLGGTFEVTTTLDDVTADAFNALVIAGGMGSPETLWNNATLHRLIQGFDAQEKLIAAICLSGAVLAKAGILKNRRATVWPADEAKQVFAEHGVNYVDEPVVIDGHIVTSPGPQAAQEFARQVTELVRYQAGATPATTT